MKDGFVGCTPAVRRCRGRQRFPVGADSISARSGSRRRALSSGRGPGMPGPYRVAIVPGGITFLRAMRRAACPQAAAAACVASQFHCAAPTARPSRKGSFALHARAGHARPLPYRPRQTDICRGFFLCRIVNFYTAFLFCDDCPNCCKSCGFDAKSAVCPTWLLDMLLKNGTINPYSYPPRTGEQKSRPRREKSEKRGKSDCSSP